MTKKTAFNLRRSSSSRTSGVPAIRAVVEGEQDQALSGPVRRRGGSFTRQRNQVAREARGRRGRWHLRAWLAPGALAQIGRLARNLALWVEPRSGQY